MTINHKNMATPWGSAQGTKILGEGAITVCTASHGGIHLSDELNAQVHEAWRNEDGWYEEDCEWSIVAYHFPSLFDPDAHRIAIELLKNWQPHQYQTVTGETLSLEDSSRLREEAFFEENKDRYIAISAIGDWHPQVPKGFVVVRADRGDRTTNGGFAKDKKYFLVPEEEYRIHTGFGFVIDESRHKETFPVS